MAKKKKKLLKKLAKAALIGGALYAGTKALGKRKLSKAVSGMDDASLGVSHFKDYITKKAKPESAIPIDPHTYRWPNKGGGIAKRGMGRAFKKGGKV